MTGERSAYATLGLRPGAGRAEVAEAYRRLMKKHHPDRPGGNSDRAANINRAYMLLRRQLGEPIRVPVAVPVRRRGLARRHLAFLAIAVILAVGVALESGEVRRALSAHGLIASPAAVFGREAGNRSLADAKMSAAALAGQAQDLPPIDADGSPFDAPLQRRIVDSAIADAIRLHARGDTAGAIDYSSDCQRSLQIERNVAWFDACAAFDEAMLTLGGVDDGQDSGRFGEPDVITRELAGAQSLSDDSLGADLRLQQIRSRVSLKVLPMLNSAPGAKP